MRELKVGDKIKVVGHKDFQGIEGLYTDIPVGTVLTVTRTKDFTQSAETITNIYFIVPDKGGERYYVSKELGIAFLPINNVKVFLNRTGRIYE